jgi:APA family basic amino acid/polyamine antiporter
MSVAFVAMVAIAMVIGAGIFKSPAIVAANTGSVFWLFAIWAIGGAVTLIGALCYAELATTYPSAGGDYTFLKRAYGRPVAFLFAWARFAVINTGSIALLGFVLGDYLSEVVSLGPNSPSIYAVIAIVGMTAFNLAGRRKGAVANYSMTGLEMAALVVLGAAALWLVMQGQPAKTTGEALLAEPAAGIGLALVFVLLAFGGWTEVATLSAEVRDPKRGMVKALVLAILAITALYMIVTWAFWRGLGLEGLAASSAPAADLVDYAWGPWAQGVLAVAVALATLTSINATIMVGARTTFACADDWPALRSIARWDDERGAPAGAIWAQSLVALALVGLGSLARDGFATMVDYTAPVYWLFLLLSAGAMIILRLRDHGLARPFQTPLFPLLPILFGIACLYMMWSSLTYVRSGSFGDLGLLAGAGVLALGGVALAGVMAAGRGLRQPAE